MSHHLQLVTAELICEGCGRGGEIELLQGHPFHIAHAPKAWKIEHEQQERFLHEARLRLLFDRSPEYWEK